MYSVLEAMENDKNYEPNFESLEDSAKDLINALTTPIEGKGGGRVEFAQGAGKPSDREKFVSDIPNIVQSLA